MKCLETRTRADGFRWRRYRGEDGQIVQTVEVPAEVWRGINGQGRSRNRAAEWSRRQERLKLRAEAERRLADGWKPEAVAHDLGVSVRTVQRWAAT